MNLPFNYSIQYMQLVYTGVKHADYVLVDNSSLECKYTVYCKTSLMQAATLFYNVWRSLKNVFKFNATMLVRDLIYAEHRLVISHTHICGLLSPKDLLTPQILARAIHNTYNCKWCTDVICSS